MSRIAIVGFSSHREEAPFDDPSWTFWGMNGLWRVLDKIPEKRWALWWEPHTREFLKLYGQKANIGTQQQEWLAKPHPFPIFMQDVDPEYPASARFPIEDVIASTGVDYFTSTIAMQLAYVLHLVQKGEKITEVGMWGIDLVHNTEWGDQRPCAEFWIGRLMQMGVKFTKHEASALLTSRYRYAYDNPNPLLIELRKAIDEQAKTSVKSFNEAKAVNEQAASKMQTEDGVIQLLKHLTDRLDQWERGARL